MELSYRAAEAFNGRDIEAFLELMDAEVQGVPLASDMVGGGYRGREGTRRWWDELLEAFPDVTIDVLEMHEADDATIAAVRMRGHGAGGATPIDETLWRVTRWRDGKCVWWGTFRSEADARGALAV